MIIMKVAQVATLVAELETKRDAAAIHIAKTDSALTPEGGLPVLICGDFNATPGSSSYELLSEGALDGGHPDLRPSDHSVAPIFTGAGAGGAGALGGAGAGGAVAGVRHGLRLSSAYVAVTGQEPDVTNVKGRQLWCHCLSLPLLRNRRCCLCYTFCCWTSLTASFSCATLISPSFSSSVQLYRLLILLSYYSVGSLALVTSFLHSLVVLLLSVLLTVREAPAITSLIPLFNFCTQHDITTT